MDIYKMPLVFVAVSESTQKHLNILLKDLFDGNALIDNMYYNLQDSYYLELANTLHVPVAHVLPELADELSDLMTKLDIRPVREATETHNYKYKNVEEIYATLTKYFQAIRAEIYSLINETDLNEEMEIKIWLENFLVEKILPLYKQAREWLAAVQKLGPDSFNIHVKEYTHFLIQ